MYESLKPFISVPFKLCKFVKQSGDGTKVYEAAADKMCYPSGKVELVTNNTGANVTSTLQLFVDIEVSYKDLVIFNNESWPVKSIATFYDGHTGLPDIRVVYL